MVSVDGAAYEALPSSVYTLINDTNATYHFKAISGSGIESNIITYTVKIDQTLPATPTVNDIPMGWQDGAVTLTVSASDILSTTAEAVSGLKSYQYSIDGGSSWSVPKTWDASTANSVDISENSDYTDLLLVKVEDTAGNESTTSAAYTVKIDKTTPVLTVSAKRVSTGALTGDVNLSSSSEAAYYSDTWVNAPVKFTLGNEATQISGTTYMVSVDGAAYEALPSNLYTLTNDTNATYRFKAISGSGIESNVITYTVKIDQTLPNISSKVPANLSTEQSVYPVISFTSNEPLVKGDGYLTVYHKLTGLKVWQIHSSNNRVRFSDDNKSVTLTLPEKLVDNAAYYVTVDAGFVTDRAGNANEALGGKDSWYFTTAAETAIPDSEIAILDYKVEVISKAGVDATETTQTIAAIADKTISNQQNVIVKADYTGNGTDYYAKLKVTPTMSATPEIIHVATTAGTVLLSEDKASFDVLIPKNQSEAIITVSLGSDGNNEFAIKIVNSSFVGVVESSGEIATAVDESNLLNAVDLSNEVAASQQLNTTVDVTVKMIVAQKNADEVKCADDVQQIAPSAALSFLDIVLEKIVTTTVQGTATEATENITNVQQPVFITLSIPVAIQGNYNYRIVREHDGQLDVLPSQVIDYGTKIRFQTDRFSTYAIVSTHQSKKDRDEKSTNQSDADTADSTVIHVESDVIVDTITASADRSEAGVINLDATVDDAVIQTALIPFYTEDNTANAVKFSAVSNDEMKWLSETGKTYWFKLNPVDFTDISAHWAKDDILFAAARGLFSGTDVGLFSPDEALTRGMFVTVIAQLCDADTEPYQRSSFKDVAANAWYAPYVEWAVQLGIISGRGDDIFDPASLITREEMSIIIAKVADYKALTLDEPVALTVFEDDALISDWAEEAVERLTTSGIIKGDAANRFYPQKSVTRAECASYLRAFIENAVQ
jgi:hypothetical protein